MLQVPPADIPPGYGEDSVEATLQHKRCALQSAATYILRVRMPTPSTTQKHLSWLSRSQQHRHDMPCMPMPRACAWAGSDKGPICRKPARAGSHSRQSVGALGRGRRARPSAAARALRGLRSQRNAGPGATQALQLPAPHVPLLRMHSVVARLVSSLCFSTARRGSRISPAHIHVMCRYRR